MIALDFLLVCLMCVCIVYSWLLNKRIQGLEASKHEFANIVRNLDTALTKASSAIEELSRAGEVAHKNLAEEVKEAEVLKCDLKLINDLAMKLATRLETIIVDIRDLEKHSLTKKVENAEGGEGVAHVDNMHKYDVESIASPLNSMPGPDNYFDTLKRIKR